MNSQPIPVNKESVVSLYYTYILVLLFFYPISLYLNEELTYKNNTNEVEEEPKEYFGFLHFF